MSKVIPKLKDVRLASLYQSLAEKSATDLKVMKLMKKVEQLDAPYRKSLLEDPKQYFDLLTRPEAFADRKKMYDLLEEARSLHAKKSWSGNFFTNLAISFYLEKIDALLVDGNRKLFTK